MSQLKTLRLEKLFFFFSESTSFHDPFHENIKHFQLFFSLKELKVPEKVPESFRLLQASLWCLPPFLNRFQLQQQESGKH